MSLLLVSGARFLNTVHPTSNSSLFLYPSTPLDTAPTLPQLPPSPSRIPINDLYLSHASRPFDRAAAAGRLHVRVPKVLPTAELEGVVAGLIIAVLPEAVGGAAVSSDVQEPQELAMEPPARGHDAGRRT